MYHPLDKRHKLYHLWDVIWDVGRHDMRPISRQSSNATSALLEDASRAARAALNAEFRPDPLFSAEISEIVSAASSAQKRHGPLIERAIAEVLEGDARIVLRNLAVPISRGALALSGARDFSFVAAQQIAFDEKDIASSIDIDLMVIDEPSHWAGAFSVKRGGGLSDPKKRRGCERELRALRFTLASHLRQNGYPEIETATTGVIDFFGQSGFAKDLTICGEELDDFFGLPVVARVEEMTARMRLELESGLEILVAGILPRAVKDKWNSPHEKSRDRAVGRPKNNYESLGINILVPRPTRNRRSN